MSPEGSIIQRISQYIKLKKLTVSEFEQLIGVSNATIRNAIKNNTSIGSDKIEKIIQTFPNIHPVWLLTGDGAMEIDPGNAPSIIKANLEIIEKSLNPHISVGKHTFGLVPLLEWKAFAGLGTNFQEVNNILSYLVVPGLRTNDGNRYVAIEVKGNSMYPTLSDGDVVICKYVENADVVSGRIYVVHTVEETFIKRVIIHIRNYVLRSDNWDKTLFKDIALVDVRCDFWEVLYKVAKIEVETSLRFQHLIELIEGKNLLIQEKEKLIQEMEERLNLMKQMLEDERNNLSK